MASVSLSFPSGRANPGSCWLGQGLQLLTVHLETRGHPCGHQGPGPRLSPIFVSSGGGLAGSPLPQHQPCPRPPLDTVPKCGTSEPGAQGRLNLHAVLSPPHLLLLTHLSLCCPISAQLRVKSQALKPKMLAVVGAGLSLTQQTLSFAKGESSRLGPALRGPGETRTRLPPSSSQRSLTKLRVAAMPCGGLLPLQATLPWLLHNLPHPTAGPRPRRASRTNRRDLTSPEAPHQTAVLRHG